MNLEDTDCVSIIISKHPKNAGYLLAPYLIPKRSTSPAPPVVTHQVLLLYCRTSILQCMVTTLAINGERYNRCGQKHSN